MVAEGTADIHLRATPTFEWDTAAGEAIAAGAGAVTATLHDEQPLKYNKQDLVNPHFYCKSQYIE